MVEDMLRYDRMVETALRDVVLQALREVCRYGLPGDHHFYLTFATTHPGVDIPKSLAAQYPEEMTIVLQHQYDDLVVTGETLGVTLSFNGVPERLTVPLAAITTFADPSVNFVLQFQPIADPAEPSQDPAASRAEPIEESPEPASVAAVAEAGGKIVTLDKFRKK